MHKSSVITNSSADQIQARRELWDMFQKYPAMTEELERSLGLFIRGSLLARLMATQDVYREIVSLPGSIVDMGTWRGQTAVMCENLRAILEPLNFQRRIHAFDTFSGYAGFGKNEARDKQLYSDGTYSLPEHYADLLAQLLKLHERNNVSGHINGKHRVWAGDCRETLQRFKDENPGETIALAWFDLNALEPTRFAFETIMERLVPGGIIAFWQLTRGGQTPAEGMHYVQDVLAKHPHTLHKAATYPSLCYMRFPRGASAA